TRCRSWPIPWDCTCTTGSKRRRSARRRAPSFPRQGVRRRIRSMSDDPRVERLLDELLDPHASPEEVCASCPALPPVVRNGWLQMRRLGADLDALFPPATQPNAPPAEPALPQVPGYEVEAELGRGGMGVVFRARHLRLARPVALKMLLAGAAAEPRD